MKFMNGWKTIIGLISSTFLMAAHTLFTVDVCFADFTQRLIHNGLDYGIGGSVVLTLIGIIHKMEKNNERLP